MSTPLLVTGNHPVQLEGFIDSASALQLKHDDDSLDDHGQHLEAEHEILKLSSETIRVELADFANGSDNWQISVTHDDNGTSVIWPRNGNHAYQDFSAMTDPLELTVTATSNASPAETKTRTVWIKTRPVDGQPDRP